MLLSLVKMRDVDEEDGGGDVSDKMAVLTEIMVVATEMVMMKRVDMMM